ncbi:MAG: hypothetical protein ACI936_000019 [Paraglaciecola sp.]|jgi:hypothetical protein
MLQPEKFSLQALALLSQCLFPGDFKEELLNIGIDNETAVDLSLMINNKSHALSRNKNIIDLYQDCLGASAPFRKRYIDAIEKYTTWFVTKPSGSFNA